LSASDACGVTTSGGLRILSPDQWGPDLGLIEGGMWREIVGPTSGATCRGLYHLGLHPGGSTRVLQHPGEAVYYLVSGEAAVSEHVDADAVPGCALDEGGMVHIRPGTAYSIASADGAVLVGGPSPVDTGLGREVSAGRSMGTPGVRGFHRDRPGLLVPFISSDARLVVWLGEGAITANMNFVVLQPGERNREHVHVESEDTIHVLAGHGTAENVTTGEAFEFGPRDTIHIEIGVWHAVAADRGETVVSVGGPCPADTNMLRAAGVDVDAITATLARA
jgi:quercetin dioxygenase-like cupin family protein